MTRIPGISRPRAHHLPRLAAMVSMLALVACATTIPDRDTTPPEVRLTVSGPGIGSQVMSNPPRDHWTDPTGVQLFDIQPGVRYNFILSVSDDGGVARAHLRMPDTFTVTGLAPEGVENTTSGVTRNLTLRGDRSSPTTGLVISGSFTAQLNVAFTFEVEGDDFGGASGSPNQRFMTVDVLVGDG